MRKYDAIFNRFTISMTATEAQACSHVGDCEADVRHLIAYSEDIRKQLLEISDAALSAELKEYGSWDDEELKDRVWNEIRILWVAAGQITDSYSELQGRRAFLKPDFSNYGGRISEKYKKRKK